MRTYHKNEKDNTHRLPAMALLVLSLGGGQALASSVHPAGIATHAGGDQAALHETTALGAEIWRGLSEEFTWLYQRGEYPQALAVAQRAHSLAVNLFGAGHINTADSLLKLGIVHQTMSHLNAARDYFEQSLQVLENGLSPDDPDIAVTLTNLGNIYFELGDQAASEQAHQRALDLRRHAFGSTSPEVAQSLYNLGVLYEHQRDYRRAADHYQNAIRLWSATLGGQHPYVGNALQNLTYAYLAQRQYDDAADTMKRRIEFKRHLLGENHREVARAYMELGALYIEQGRYLTAGEAYGEALAILERQADDDHPQLALLLYSLGNAYHLQARSGGDDSELRLHQALPYYERALATLDGNGTADSHPTLQIILSELALLYRALGENGKAKATELRLAQLAR